jgi:hypothetical protein
MRPPALNVCQCRPLDVSIDLYGNQAPENNDSPSKTRHGAPAATAHPASAPMKYHLGREGFGEERDGIYFRSSDV